MTIGTDMGASNTLLTIILFTVSLCVHVY